VEFELYPPDRRVDCCRECSVRSTNVLTSSDDSVYLPLGIRNIPSLPVAVLPNIRLSLENSCVPSTL